jgi:steroid delta-isomerase-like uncharacterized protein
VNETDCASSTLIEQTVRAPILRKLLAAVNDHDVSSVAALFAEDYEGLDVSRAQLQQGRDAAQEDYDEWFQAFPDLRLTVTEMMTLPERVAISWTREGTHQGTFLHVPPTGQHIMVCGISILTLHQGTITQGIHLWDMAGLFRAMKLLPELPTNGHRASQALLLSTFLQQS